jgi:hypothetical protein
VEKTTVLSFGFMVIEFDGNISLEVFDDLVAVASLKNCLSLAASLSVMKQ